MYHTFGVLVLRAAKLCSARKNEIMSLLIFFQREGVLFLLFYFIQSNAFYFFGGRSLKSPFHQNFFLFGERLPGPTPPFYSSFLDFRGGGGRGPPKPPFYSNFLVFGERPPEAPPPFIQIFYFRGKPPEALYSLSTNFCADLKNNLSYKLHFGFVIHLILFPL